MPRRSDVALTVRMIEQLEPRARQYAVYDARETGLMVIVHPSGRKAFAVRYLNQAGVRRNRSIGDAGRITSEALEAARRRARAMRDAAAAGNDPAQEERDERARARKIGTYKDVVEDFIEKHCKPRQRTWAQTRRILLKAAPAWEKRPIRAITKSDAYEVLDGILGKGQHAKARVTLTWWRALWEWAATREIVAAPIMDNVSVEIELRVRTRRYTDDEIRAAWAAADGLEPIPGAYVKLCILLAPRKTELAHGRRSEMDDADRPTLWTVPHERTKSKKRAKHKRVYLVPLPPLAQRIIRSLPKHEGSEDLLFPGRRAKQPLSPTAWLARKIRKASGIEDWTFHACRDTVASWLQDQERTKYERGLVLNHAGPGSVTDDYSHGYPLKLKRELLEQWADHVAGVVKPEGVVVLS